MDKIQQWQEEQRERKKLNVAPYQAAVSRLNEYLATITEESIETGIDPEPDEKRWILLVDGTAWRLLSKISGRTEKGDLAKQREELLDRLHNFSVEAAPRGGFMESRPFDGTITVKDPTGSPIHFVCQLNQKDQEAFTNLALPARKLWMKLKPASDEPEEEA
jgi:hypothetical protein